MAYGNTVEEKGESRVQPVNAALGTENRIFRKNYTMCGQRLSDLSVSYIEKDRAP